MGRFRKGRDGKIFRVAWNPINAPEADSGTPRRYPVTPGAPYGDEIRQRQLLYHRTFTFSHEDNAHSFRWQWQGHDKSVLFPLPGTENWIWPYIGDEYRDQTTRLRVAWFTMDEYLEPDYEHETTYSREFWSSLEVLDVSDPATSRVVGRSVTPGPGWDVAWAGGLVCLAHGWLGIGVYRLSGSGEPELVDWVWPWGRVVALAGAHGLLAARKSCGQVLVYQVTGEGLEALARFEATRHVTKLRFQGRFLWVMGLRGTDVYDMGDPAAPVRLARLGAEGLRWAWRTPRGRYAVGLDHGRVMLEEAVER